MKWQYFFKQSRFVIYLLTVKRDHTLYKIKWISQTNLTRMPTVVLHTENVSITYTLKVQLTYILCGHSREPEKWKSSWWGFENKSENGPIKVIRRESLPLK